MITTTKKYLLLVALLALAVVPLRASETTVTAVKLLSGAAAANTKAAVSSAFMSRCRSTAVYIDWSTGVNAGTVTVETAVDENYTGTWSLLTAQAFNTSAASVPKQDLIAVTGVLWAIRTRISTSVTGGTVSSWLVCN